MIALCMEFRMADEQMTLSELTTVRLIRPAADWLLGAIGTVVHCYREGVGYEVEFTCPCCPPQVLTLNPDDIEKAE